MQVHKTIKRETNERLFGNKVIRDKQNNIFSIYTKV